MQGPEFVGVDQIGLVEDDQIRFVQLPEYGVTHEPVGGTRADGLRIGEHDHRIDPESRVQADREGDRAGQRDAAGLDDHELWRWVALPQIYECAHEVAAERAAHTAAGDADEVVFLGLDQIGIDRKFAEIVDEHRDLQSLRIAQQMVDQGGLAGAEIPADDADGYRSAQSSAAGNTRPP